MSKILTGRGRRSRWAIAGLAAAALAGCGGPAGGSAGAGDAAARFAVAVSAGDGDTACALLTPRARESVTGATDEVCADVITSLDESGSEAAGVQVWGDAARVEVGGDTLFLLHSAEGWLVDAAGCEPTSDGPYNCAVEG